MSDNDKPKNLTSFQEWMKPHVEGVDIQLPSGKVVKLRPLTITVFLKSRKGKIPDSLTPLVDELMNTGQADESRFLLNASIDQQVEFADFMDEMIIGLFLYPKLTMQEEYDQEKELMPVSWVSEEDKHWVLQFFNQPAKVLEHFRYPEKTYVDVVAEMQELQQEAQRIATGETVGERPTGELSTES